MDNNEQNSPFEGARDKCIYILQTFVNQDGFKVEEHKPIDDKEAIPQFYGFYLINTEMGPVDRYFKFKNKSTIDECFDNFKELAEEDAKILAGEMKRQNDIHQQQASVENQMGDELPPDEAFGGRESDTQLLDEHGSPLS